MLCTCNRSSSSYQKKNRSSSCFLLYLAQELAHVRRQLHLRDSRCSENKQLVRRRLLSLVVKWCQILSRASNSNIAKYMPSPRPEWTNGMKRTQIRSAYKLLLHCSTGPARFSWAVPLLQAGPRKARTAFVYAVALPTYSRRPCRSGGFRCARVTAAMRCHPPTPPLPHSPAVTVRGAYCSVEAALPSSHPSPLPTKRRRRVRPWPSPVHRSTPLPPPPPQATTRLSPRP